MTNKLQQYFPLLRSREEILADIHASLGLLSQFASWTTETQNVFPLIPPGECHCNMGISGASRKMLQTCYIVTTLEITTC